MSPSRFGSAAASTRRRSTARPSLPASTLRIVAIAVSRNTGAIASWITWLMSVSGAVFSMRYGFGATDKPRAPWRSISSATNPDAFTSATNSRRYCARAGRLLDRRESAFQNPRTRNPLDVGHETRPQARERIELVGDEAVERRVEP